MICSMCGGEVIQDDMTNSLKCSKCGRSKNMGPRDRQTVHEVDMDDDTKDLDVIME